MAVREIRCPAAELKETFWADTRKDAGMGVTLDPGAYTVHVTGAAGTTGWVEIFEVE